MRASNSIIGNSAALAQALDHVSRLAPVNRPILVLGERGTGKELAARIIHNSSVRKNSRFVAINCGCFSNDLLIEELIGRGNDTRPGASQASGTITGSDPGGTILLDQIEDMSAKMQLSMLKIIDSKKLSLQDGVNDFPFDVRILASSRYDLSKLVEEGKFRDELYYRLNVMPVKIPPLRERKEDIPVLCHHHCQWHRTAAGPPRYDAGRSLSRKLFEYSKSFH